MKIYGLIGKSLGHSWSKGLFETRFATENRTDCSYRNFQLTDISGIRPLVLQNPAIAGLNVTIPFKKDVIPHLDNMDKAAAEIGAVNCIKVSRNWQGVILKGYNTDCPAFRTTMEPYVRAGIDNALILGTGGAASAVRHALNELGINARMVSRTKTEDCLIYAELTGEMISQVRLIANCTPAGMTGFEQVYPQIPYEALSPDHMLYDLVYNPDETLFLRKGRQAGAMTKNGMDMLKLQAELSWKIWNP